jgi:hypothetical protein
VESIIREGWRRQSLQLANVDEWVVNEQNRVTKGGGKGGRGYVYVPLVVY